MKTFFAIVILAFPLSSAVSAQNRGNDARCQTCAQTVAVPQIEAAAVKIRLHRAHHRLQEIMEIGCAVSQSTRGVPGCEERGVTTNPH